MPLSSTDAHLPRLPALDGLRAVALGAVLLFHADYTWARGGHLGVTAFFTLSGFLITSLLLSERELNGRIDLVAFWGRRARRLVPAALVCLALVVAYVAASRELSFDGLVGDAAASVTWFANWRFVAEGEAYSDLFSSPSPFQHFWSLAIEEQFYLALPLVATVGLGLRGGRTRRAPLCVIALLVLVASTVAAARLHTPGELALRAYYGTDARIAEPLVGVVLALILVGPSGLRRFGLAGRRAADVAGVLALGGLAVLVSKLSTWDSQLYEGGFLLAALLSGVVVTAATQRGGVVDRILSAPILVGVGRISYGAYLFHWPVYLWMTEDSTGLAGGMLFGARIVVTLSLAAISYALIELPVRDRRIPVQVTALAWPTATVGLIGALVAALALPVPALSEQVTSGLPGGPPSSPTPRDAEGHVAEASPSTGERDAAAVEAAVDEPSQESALGPSGSAEPEGSAATPSTTAPPAPVSAVRVAIVGDSLAGNLGRGFEIWASRSQQVAVASFAVQSCPVSRGGTRKFPNGYEWVIKDECAWWAQSYSERFRGIQEFAPDVVVIQDSFAMLPDRKLEEWPNYRRPGEPLFDTWLIREYDRFIDTMGQQGAAIVMTNAVCADFESHSPWRSLDDAYERVAALNRQVYPVFGPRARVADLNAELCPNGQYTDSAEGYPNARPDGFHLIEEAAAALVERWLGPIAIEAADAGPA